MDEESVGRSQGFVLAKGFEQVGDRIALIGHDGGRRLFGELTADPDRLDVRPDDAYRALLSSMQPGWAVRLLQIRWPDPQPRGVFLTQIRGWEEAERVEGLALLGQGLALFLEEAPLPFRCRTILEAVMSGEEGLAWWEGLSGLLGLYGLHIRQMSAGKIEELARQIFNPDLE